MGEAARKLVPEPDPIAAKIARSTQVAVLPQVVCRIAEIAGSDDASVATLERAILIDPGLSAKILTQANSAAYCLPRSVTSIRDAVILMGFREVRQVALAAGVFDLFVGRSDKESLRRRAWWRTSLDSAVCAHALTRRWPMIGSDEAYTCGLLHLIGKTLLDRSDSRKYTRIHEVVEKGVPDILAERAIFKTDHVATAIEAARIWGLNDRLATGLDYVTPDSGHDEADLCALVSVSHRISELALSGRPADTDPATLLPQWACKALEIPAQDVEQVIQVGIQAIASAANKYL